MSVNKVGGISFNQYIEGLTSVLSQACSKYLWSQTEGSADRHYLISLGIIDTGIIKNKLHLQISYVKPTFMELKCNNHQSMLHK